MSDAYYEFFYFWIIIIFWLIIPFIFTIWFFRHLCKMCDEYKFCKDEIENGKWKIKWGKRKDGTMYIEDEGWGMNYDKRSKLEYFTERNEIRHQKEVTKKENTK